MNIKQFLKFQIDELVIELAKMIDAKGNQVGPVWKDQPPQQDYADTSTFQLINQKRTRKQIDLIVLPFHSAFLRFKIQAKKEKVIESKMEVQFKPLHFKSMNITYSYIIHEGFLTFQPPVYRY